MKYSLKIDPEKVGELTEHPHPPLSFTSSVAEGKFAAEIKTIRATVQRELEASGFSRSLIGYDGDFYMNDDFGAFRTVDFVMLNPKMASVSLIKRLAALLQRHADYVIKISNEFEQDLQLFNIVLTHKEGVGEFETRTMAAAMGFDLKSGPIGPIDCELPEI